MVWLTVLRGGDGGGGGGGGGGGDGGGCYCCYTQQLQELLLGVRLQEAVQRVLRGGRVGACFFADQTTVRGQCWSRR